MNDNYKDLRQEFDKLIAESCINPEANADAQSTEDETQIPHYIQELQKRLLAPSISGVYLTRIDLKRIADELDYSLPIKERKNMLRNLMRHTTTRATLQEIFDVTSRHINGRILMFEEMGQAFPASKPILDGFIAKAQATQRMFGRIVEDFEEIEPTDDPMAI
ncbi:MAG: hypothetical protein KU37_04915 [Sulfuricurvum sp. PC08-66]|nr:MAG: hypothetical protein KU37_04915 [Sulfuricurvum sp. PC08-66]